MRRSQASSRTCRRFRGSTLLELTIAMAILSTLVTAVYATFSASLHTFYVQAGATDVSRSASLAMSQMVGDLSACDAVSVRTSAQGIVLASPRTDTGLLAFDISGDMYWQRWVCYYVDSRTGYLVRKEQKMGTAVPNPPAVPATMTPAWFQSLAASPHVLVPYATTLAATSATPLMLTLTSTNAPLGTAYRNQVQIQEHVRLRN